jgi:Domain of unknown function (DUF4350)
MKAERFFIVVLLAVVLAFGLGIAHLFVLRFQHGDVYPPYSSLRTDPLGTKALYKSLDNLPGFDVQRNYKPLAKLAVESRQTVLFFGLPASAIDSLQEYEAHDLESLPGKGDRLVISLLPTSYQPAPKKETPKEDEKRPKKTVDEEEEEDFKLVSLTNRWGFTVAYGLLKTNATTTGFTWHTTLFFDELDPAWRVIESRGRHPMLIERKFGDGTIVLAADSYFVSNEAMRRERHPQLLAWLVGENRQVVFDETHLGVREDPGVMTLARRYRLHGLFAGLILLAVLFLWKSFSSFVPPYQDGAAHANVALATGKDSAEGFVNLLRRNIAQGRVLSVCVEEWKKSFAHRQSWRTTQRLQRIQAIADAQEALPASQRDPVGSYRTISQILSERK